MQWYLVQFGGEDEHGRPLRRITNRLHDASGNDVEAWGLEDIPLGPYDIGAGHDVRKIDRLYLETTKRDRLTDQLYFSVIGGALFLRDEVADDFKQSGIQLDPEVVEVPVDIVLKGTGTVRGRYVMWWPPRRWDVLDHERCSSFDIGDAKPNSDWRYTKMFDIVVDRGKCPPFDLFRSEFKTMWFANERVVELVSERGYTNFDFEQIALYSP